MQHIDVPAVEMKDILQSLLDEVIDVGRRMDAAEQEIEFLKVEKANVTDLDHPFI